MPLNRPLLLLGLGAAAGLALAAAGILTRAERVGALSDDAVARVNGVPLRVEHYRQLLEGLESDLGRTADEDERTHLLDRMIEEELLVQRGLELGLARSDRRVRGDLVSAVIDAAIAEAESAEPDDSELRDFYAEERELFTRPGRQRVRQIFFRNGGEERAIEARRRLAAGEPFDEVRVSLGDEEILRVPDALLPAAKLREYLGPAALQAAYELEPGDVSAPVRFGSGTYVIELVAREPERVPAFEEVRAQLRTEWRRRQSERALREVLDELRARAALEVRDTLP